MGKNDEVAPVQMAFTPPYNYFICSMLLFLELNLRLEIRIRETQQYAVEVIDGLQSIPRESNDKDVAAMLDELTIEANEESFVIVLQHGGNDVTCK